MWTSAQKCEERLAASNKTKDEAIPNVVASDGALATRFHLLMLRSVLRPLRPLARRHASAMAQPPCSPAEPLVVILGSTGTGKSDLAVELACRFNGEIINADAMQMYRGLPVTTNKISVDEQRGVPHHLLGTIGLDEPTWQVGHFRREAARIIRAIRDRGRLPIVVGGTQYYTDGLLFDDHLVDASGDQPQARDSDDGASDGESAGGSAAVDTVDHSVRFPILNEPTDVLHARLREVDPAMADRWHPNDRRKIRRSLEIFLTTGRRASDIYAEQRQRREEKKQQQQQRRRAGAAWNCLLFWVYAQPEALQARLDARVDTMLARGLLPETAAMHDTRRALEARGTPVDRSKGIWQSIGYKEMEPYWAAVRASAGTDDSALTVDIDTAAADADPAVAASKQAGLDGIRFGTRRYARYQLNWLRQKTIPLLAVEHALDRLFLLDGTDRAHWHETVAATGVRLTSAFLAGEPLPAPADVSETARTVLAEAVAAARTASENSARPAFQKTCEACQTTLVTEDQWNKHIRGHRHRRVLQRRKRWALVPAEVRAALEQKGKTVPSGVPADDNVPVDTSDHNTK